MSLNNDLLMEFIDDEIPTQYRQSIEERLSADPILARRLKTYTTLRKFMQNEAKSMLAADRESVARLGKRLDAVNLSLDKGVPKPPAFSLLPFRWAAALAALVLITALLVSPDNIGRFPQGLNLTNSTEFLEYDPAFIDVLSVNQDNTVSEDGDGIELQVNVQDIEQLLMLLEKTRNFNGSINTLTIQLPDINEFELLGESQFLQGPAP